MKKTSIYTILLIIFLAGAWFLAPALKMKIGEMIAEKKREIAVNDFLDSRRGAEEDDGEVDLFKEDGVANILLVGLDTRAGETEGHCDVIQFLSIDKNKNNITITAVPRGTYSNLPYGTAATSTDYYVSNACGKGGLEYGVKQVEKILGEKADYLAVVGFSEAVGIFRKLKLPTTETLQWLRHRQGYAIGEPQRARNHSTFLKEMLIRFVSRDDSRLDAPLQYILYKIIKTDLTFSEVRNIAEVLASMDIANHPERVILAMRPAYDVQDIPYDPESEDITAPIKDWLDRHKYLGLATGEDAQVKIIELINNNSDDVDFITWAFDNNLWLQIEDDGKRLTAQYDILEKYLGSLSNTEKRKNIIADYILEMDYYGEGEWAEKGRVLLGREVE